MTKAPNPNVVNVPVSDEFQSVTELATTLGITPRTIRFYEAKGLIAPRRVGNMRVYTALDRARMKLILRGKKVGFTLRGIKEFLDLYDADPLREKQNRFLLKGVRERIQLLKDRREALEQALAGLYELEAAALKALSEAGWDEKKRKTSTK